MLALGNETLGPVAWQVGSAWVKHGNDPLLFWRGVRSYRGHEYLICSPKAQAAGWAELSWESCGPWACTRALCAPCKMSHPESICFSIWSLSYLKRKIGKVLPDFFCSEMAQIGKRTVGYHEQGKRSCQLSHGPQRR